MPRRGFILKDEQQEENLTILNESYAHIYTSLIGEEDDPATPEDESASPRIPAKEVLDSHFDLLREALELEKSKKKSWREHALENGMKED